MGLFLNLLTLPVSGPVGGTIWIAEQVRAAAEREYYDEASIREQLLELEQRFQAGEIAEEEYEEVADELVERLLAAGELRDAPGGVEMYVAEEEQPDA
jgi:cytochrome c-type biogenesis protein CcmI